MGTTNEWERFDERNSKIVMMKESAYVVVGVWEHSGKWYWYLYDAKHGFQWDPSLPPLATCEPSETEAEAMRRAEDEGRRWLERNETGA